MPRKPTDSLDIKVRPEPHEKAAFLKAAEKARQSLNQWMIQAAVERAEREGIPVDRKRAAR